MDDATYKLTLSRLDEALEQARELAGEANAEMLTYLIEMARLELQVMQTGDDILSTESLMKLMQKK